MSRAKATVPKSLLARGDRRLSFAPAPSPGLKPFPLPNVANLGPVEQPPSIGCLVSPTHIPWVSPQQSYLIRGVASMPQSIPEVLTWARYGCHCLELKPWLGHCSERRGLPVGLLRLFPHDHIEAATVLVTEEEARIVIISDCVHVEGAFKVHAIKGRVPNCKTRVTVHSLNNFHALGLIKEEKKP